MMNQKRVWAVIPILLLPYFTLFTLATIFLSTKVSFFKWMMEFVFRNNALFLIAVFLACCFLVGVWSAICFGISIYKKRDALALAKLFMIVKLIQIPAYVSIFVLGVLLAITIFTLPFTIALIFLDYFSLILSGLGVISAVIHTIRQSVFKPKELFGIVIAQFVFCLDVVASIILYVKLKKAKTDTQKELFL